MRCATCGTDNAPDSRFCGGCGARMGPEQRLAPTAKISDDAPFASVPTTPRAVVRGPASIPPHAMATPVPGAMVRPPSQPAYGSMPPTAPRPQIGHGPASIPPMQPRSVQASSASASIAAAPGRPVGLIVVVLIADLGLAAAGAVLLGKGLSGDKKTAPAPSKNEPKAPSKMEPAPKGEQKTEAPAPAPAIEAIAAATPGVVPAVEPIAASKSVVAAQVAAARTGSKSSKSTSSSKSGKPGAAKASSKGASGAETASGPVTSPGGAGPITSPGGNAAPEDPYEAPSISIDAQVAKHMAKSKAAFDRCVGDAAPVHGSIQIAFRVLDDGRVVNADAVSNSTGNIQLARCLTSTIGTWRLSAHSGPALNFVRPFNYP